jgi:hypothetical protein
VHILLNLVVLCYIIGVAALPSKQEGHFATASVALIRLLKTSVTLFFDTIASIRYNLTYIRLQLTS